MHKILVAGSTGFLGRHFISHVVNKYAHYELLGFDRETDTEKLDELVGNPNYEFLSGDIREWERTKKGIQDCDAFINFADVSQEDSEQYNTVERLIANNIFTTQILLEMCKWHRPSRFIQVSTCDVYGHKDKGSFNEKDPLLPATQYAATKAASEVIAHSYSMSELVPVIIVRVSNVFGPHQELRNYYADVAQHITNALDDEPIRLGAGGASKRDWLYISDCCSAIDAALHFGEVGEVYNIASGEERTDLQISRQILKHLKKPESLIHYDPAKTGQKTRASINIDKLKGIGYLGWEPEHTFSKALKETIGWYESHGEWWKGQTLS